MNILVSMWSFVMPVCAASVLNTSIVVIWLPAESRFFANETNTILHKSLRSAHPVTVVEGNEISRFFTNEYQQISTAWTIFVDLREYACPEEVFQDHLLAYVSITRIPCNILSARTEGAFAKVVTRTFDRGTLVTQVTNSTQRTHSLALLFDHTGEEYFHERPSRLTQPLVFEVSVALDKCTATEQLKNLTAKTEIRDVVVVARADCITDLLTEMAAGEDWVKKYNSSNNMLQASSLQLMFGRYRWLVHPTDGKFPGCRDCKNVNVIILMEEDRPQDLPDTREEKIVRFIEKSIAELSSNQIDDCNTCSDACKSCVQFFKSAMLQVAGDDVMLNFKDNGSVYDLYMLTPNETTLVGQWSESDGLKTDTRDLFPESKGDIVLRAVVVIEPPFVIRKQTANETIYTGYSLDVLRKISELVGFSFVVYECDNNDYGSSDADGEWGGCVGNVKRGEADVIVGALTVTAEREEVVDFTLPYYDFAGIQIMMKKQENEVKLFYFIEVFTTEAWLCLFGVIVLTSFLLFFFERFSPHGDSSGNPQQKKAPAGEVNGGDGLGGVGGGRGGGGGGGGGEGGGGNGANEEPRAFDLKESIWFVVGSVTLAGGGEPPRCLASRLLVAGFWFFSVVIMSTFTANLAAFLTVSRMGTTINSLDELATQSEFSYSVVRDSNVKSYFEHQAAIERNFYELWKNMSLGGTVGTITERNLAVWDYPLGDKFGNMWSAMVTTGLLNSTQDGVDKVLQEKFALITESPVIKYLVSQDCKLTSIGDQFSIRPYAFALKEKSLFTSKFTTAILKLQKKRELENLKRKWWEADKVKCPPESRDQGLDLPSLTGTFIVMGGGLCVGVIVLGMEFLVVTRKKKQKLNRRMSEKKEMETTRSKPISTVEHNVQNAATLDQLMMARDLKKKLELRRST